MSPRVRPGLPVFACDVGGTDIKSAMVNEHGELIDIRRTPTPRGDDPAEAVLNAVSTLAEDYREQHRLPIQAIGLVVPGLVDEATGIARYSANLGWRGVPIHAMAEARLGGLPVALGHDVRAAAVAESQFGAGRGSRHMLAVIIGTGIASAIVLDGVGYAGTGTAGEIGHGVFDPAGPPCDCGSRGCLENIISARALTTSYAKRTGHDLPGTRELLEHAERGDVDARAVWDEAVTALAVGLTRSCALLAPDTIVLGGGVARAGAALFEPLEAQMSEFLGIQPMPRLLAAELGDDAGLIGSIWYAQTLAEERLA